MKGRDPGRLKIPVLLYVGAVLGGVLGACIGYALCQGYDIVYGPFFPQAGADLHPAGWVGWWLAKGAAIGAVVGSLPGALVAIWGLFGRSRRSA
jgi:hypothetical protein